MNGGLKNMRLNISSIYNKDDNFYLTYKLSLDEQLNSSEVSPTPKLRITSHDYSKNFLTDEDLKSVILVNNA